MRQYECNIIQQVWILKGYTDHTRYTEGALREEWSLIDANKQRKNSLLFGKNQHICVVRACCIASITPLTISHSSAGFILL